MAWQRCYVHFLRNALDYVPRKVDDDCLQELRWFYDRRDLAEVRRDIATWLAKWQAKYPRLCNWVEDNIEQTLTYYRLPLPHHKHMKSTNMLERLNQELKRRTHVVRIFPNAESCLRLVRALAVEMHENWLEATRYLNMDHLKEHKKDALRALAADRGADHRAREGQGRQGGARRVRVRVPGLLRRAGHLLRRHAEGGGADLSANRHRNLRQGGLRQTTLS